MSAVGAVENRGVVGLTSLNPRKRTNGSPHPRATARHAPLPRPCLLPCAALPSLAGASILFLVVKSYLQRSTHAVPPQREERESHNDPDNSQYHVHVLHVSMCVACACVHEHRNTNEDKCNTGETERAQHHARRSTTPQTNRTETIHLAHVSHASPHKTANSSSSSKRMLPSSAHHARIDRRRISILGTIQLTHRGPRRERRSAGVHTPRWNSLLLLRRLLLL